MGRREADRPEYLGAKTRERRDMDSWRLRGGWGRDHSIVSPSERDRREKEKEAEKEKQGLRAKICHVLTCQGLCPSEQLIKSTASPCGLPLCQALGCVLCRYQLFYSFQQPQEVAAAIMPISQTREVRLRP